MTNDHQYEQQALEMQDRAATMTDDALVTAYQLTEEAGEPWADALAGEIERRGLDI